MISDSFLENNPTNFRPRFSKICISHYLSLVFVVARTRNQTAGWVMVNSFPDNTGKTTGLSKVDVILNHCEIGDTKAHSIQLSKSASRHAVGRPPWTELADHFDSQFNSHLQLSNFALISVRIIVVVSE